eukprot:m.62057 g.62057  ORF g.62057 m.62057 type:complete len:346 (+) comp35035_c0_seq1:128-1165(+)
MNVSPLVLCLALLVVGPLFPAVDALVCFNCTGADNGSCAITSSSSSFSVSSLVDCSEGEICFTAANKRGCLPKPIGYSGDRQLIGDKMVCNTDACNSGPAGNLTCYHCSQGGGGFVSTAVEDCMVNEKNKASMKVEDQQCNFGQYCTVSISMSPISGTIASFQRKCAAYNASVCLETEHNCSTLYSTHCHTCCTSDKCNDNVNVTEPIMCYQCSQTGPNAEKNCAITDANRDASYLSRVKCKHSEEVCLTRKEIAPDGSVASFLRTCLDTGRCHTGNCEFDTVKSGEVCSKCSSILDTTSTPPTNATTTDPVTTNATPSSGQAIVPWILAQFSLALLASLLSGSA